MGLFKRKPKISEGERYYILSVSDKAHKREYLEKSAQLGYCHGKQSLAIYYLEHMPNNMEKMQEAAALYTEILTQNIWLDYYKAGQIFTKVEQHEKAMECYLKAAEEGNIEAQLYVSRSYMNGQWISRNYTKAAYWYKKAADQGNATACGIIAALYYEGNLIEKNIEAALHYAQKGEYLNNNQSAYILAQMYKEGRGVKKNLKQAIKIMDGLARCDYEKSKPLLEQYKQEMFNTAQTLRKNNKTEEAKHLLEYLMSYNCPQAETLLNQYTQEDAELLFQKGMKNVLSPKYSYLEKAADLDYAPACSMLLHHRILQISYSPKKINGERADLTASELKKLIKYWNIAEESGRVLSENDRKFLLHLVQNYALNYIDEKDASNALELLEPIRRYKDPYCLFLLAQAFTISTQYERASTALKQILEHPDATPSMRKESQRVLNILNKEMID